MTPFITIAAAVERKTISPQFPIDLSQGLFIVVI